MQEHEVRNAMQGKTILGVIYVLDHGREKMTLVFDGFNVHFEPVATKGTEYVHLKHTWEATPRGGPHDPL